MLKVAMVHCSESEKSQDLILSSDRVDRVWS